MIYKIQIWPIRDAFYLMCMIATVITACLGKRGEGDQSPPNPTLPQVSRGDSAYSMSCIGTLVYLLPSFFRGVKFSKFVLGDEGSCNFSPVVALYPPSLQSIELHLPASPPHAHCTCIFNKLDRVYFQGEYRKIK